MQIKKYFFGDLWRSLVCIATTELQIYSRANKPICRKVTRIKNMKIYIRTKKERSIQFVKRRNHEC